MGGLGAGLDAKTIESLKDFKIKLGARECVKPKCGDREKVMPDGSCEKCDDFTVVSADKKECEMPKCDFN